MKSFRYIAFYKPYGVLCQFTGEEGDKTLADFDLPKGVYPAGRLDKDSEGLLFLTDDGIFNQKITNPKSKKEKVYYIQVERNPNKEALTEMAMGLDIKDYKTKKCVVKIIESPPFPDRDPPIRYRKNVPTAWLEVILTEGKNRQVRRMSAKIGHPTLRLIRVKIGKLNLADLSPGQWREIKTTDII